MDETKWLIARELPRLRRYARALRNDAGADDLVQDCLERALRKSELWRRGSNMRAWLFKILYNVHLSSLRDARRAPAIMPLDELGGVLSERGRQLDSIELEEMSRALARLPVEQRDVITLVALEGMRYDEAADVLGISMGTVRSRLSRGRAALRDATCDSEIASEAGPQEAGPPPDGSRSRAGSATGAPRLRRVK